MSELEQVSSPILRPLMHGNQVELTKQEQMQVAIWCAKTMMTAEFLDKAPYYFTSEDRLNLMTNSKIPYPVVFYLSCYVGVTNTTIHKYHLPLLLSGEGDNLTCNAYSATITIKHLALQLFSHRGPKDLETVDVTFTLPFKDTFVQVWPIRTAKLRWPPPLAFDDDGLRLFRDRWKNLA